MIYVVTTIRAPKEARTEITFVHPGARGPPTNEGLEQAHAYIRFAYFQNLDQLIVPHARKIDGISNIRFKSFENLLT